MSVVARDVFCLYPTPRGHVAALRGLTLEVAPGEKVLVHGPNGSGKTTLLKVLAGQQSPSAGTVSVCGVDLVGAAERDRVALRARTLGLIDQSHARTLRPELSVRDNVALQLRLTGTRPRAARRAADELLDELGLTALRSRRPVTLSGGEAQRVAVCAAVAHRPALVLADEPTGELDRDGAAEVHDLLVAVTAAHGAALILVSHDTQADRIVDRVVRVRDGRLSEEWRPEAGHESLVVDDRGWIRLPEPMRRAAHLGDRVRAATDGTTIVLRNPTLAETATPVPATPSSATSAEPAVLGPAQSDSPVPPVPATSDDPVTPVPATSAGPVTRVAGVRAAPLPTLAADPEVPATAGAEPTTTPGSAPPAPREWEPGSLESPAAGGPAAGRDGLRASLTGVTVDRGGRRVLDGQRLDIRAGALTVIRGRSGSGKTTLLRILTGLDRPDHGTARVDDIDLFTLDRAGLAGLRRRLIGVAGQGTALLETLDVTANLELVRQVRGLPDDAGAVAHWLAAFGLVGIRHRTARLLSGGERQRVSLARVFVAEPSIAVLDEPTSQQDEANAEQIVTALTEAAATGVAVVAATHDPVLAAAADTVVTLF